MKYQGLVHFDPKKELLYFVPRNVLGFFLFQTYFFLFNPPTLLGLLGIGLHNLF